MRSRALIQRLLMCRLSRGDKRRRRDQRGRPQEEKPDFLKSDGEGSIETRGNVVRGDL